MSQEPSDPNFVVDPDTTPPRQRADDPLAPTHDDDCFESEVAQTDNDIVEAFTSDVARSSLSAQPRETDKSLRSVTTGCDHTPPSTTTGDEDDSLEEGERDEFRSFPDEFYDPISGNLMTDPVVNPAGDSFERNTFNISPGVSMFTNRALRDIIDREVELSSISLVGSLRRMNAVLWKGWGRLLEQSPIGTQYRPLPKSFYCPITCELLSDPVVSNEGITYEREAIEHWIHVNGKSPLTRQPLFIADLRPNNAIYDLLQKETGRASESIHPSIRRWRETESPSPRAQPLTSTARILEMSPSTQSTNQRAPPRQQTPITIPPQVLSRDSAGPESFVLSLVFAVVVFVACAVVLPERLSS